MGSCSEEDPCLLSKSVFWGTIPCPPNAHSSNYPHSWGSPLWMRKLCKLVSPRLHFQKYKQLLVSTLPRLSRPWSKRCFSWSNERSAKLREKDFCLEVLFLGESVWNALTSHQVARGLWAGRWLCVITLPSTVNGSEVQTPVAKPCSPRGGPPH